MWGARHGRCTAVPMRPRATDRDTLSANGGVTLAITDQEATIFGGIARPCQAARNPPVGGKRIVVKNTLSGLTYLKGESDDTHRCD